LTYAGRNASAAPAVGYMSVHVKEQQALVTQALMLDKVRLTIECTTSFYTCMTR